MAGDGVLRPHTHTIRFKDDSVKSKLSKPRNALPRAAASCHRITAGAEILGSDRWRDSTTCSRSRNKNRSRPGARHLSTRMAAQLHQLALSRHTLQVANRDNPDHTSKSHTSRSRRITTSATNPNPSIARDRHQQVLSGRSDDAPRRSSLAIITSDRSSKNCPPAKHHIGAIVGSQYGNWIPERSRRFGCKPWSPHEQHLARRSASTPLPPQT